ncbi:MAG: MoaD/ThiS family protein [Acidobacteria bacterium]|nr:MoaD/ThiS family protein [Acidobacteriota bacterium]
MVTFMLPSHLFDLLPEDYHATRSSLISVSLNSGSWKDLVLEIQARFPLLAERVLTESGSLASGFVLAVNDEIIRRDFDSLKFNGGDEFSIIAAMAGG